jgi:hypothetical protein
MRLRTGKAGRLVALLALPLAGCATGQLSTGGIDQKVENHEKKPPWSMLQLTTLHAHPSR